VELLQAWQDAPEGVLRGACQHAAQHQHWHAAVLLAKHFGELSEQHNAEAAALVETWCGASLAAMEVVAEAYVATPHEQEAAAHQRQQWQRVGQRIGLQSVVVTQAIRKQRTQQQATQKH
jgi:hypothetical protein